MKTLYRNIYLLAILLIGAIAMTACNDDNTSDLQLEGNTMIQALTLSGYEAEIDNTAKTVFVGVPVDCDLSTLRLDGITLSPGAKADIAIGELLDCSVPRNITITNGDVYTRYTMTVRHDDVQVLSASLNNKYTAAVDNVARTILVFVPMNEDITAMALYYTLSDGAKATPEAGTVLDFTSPVTLTATYRTATIPYTVTVIKDEMSQEPKAFIGMAGDVESLSAEAKAAAEWMFSNVPNSRYVCLQSVLDGTVKLSDFKMVWCHFDWTDWPGILWDTRDLFNDYYIKGGNILASRDGARYINDVWRITKDQQSPNNMFGGETYETLGSDLGFSIAGHEEHPIFKELPTDDNKRVILLPQGAQNSNRTLQWVTDWGNYTGMESWEEQTGGKALAFDHDGATHHITIAEFAPRDILDGYRSGTVITVGTPAYEWFDPNGTPNPYKETMVLFTKNMINYLCQ